MEHPSKDMEHSSKDMEHSSKDMEHPSKDMEHSSKDMEHSSKDMELSRACTEPVCYRKVALNQEALAFRHEALSSIVPAVGR
jgi:hypothetical protein